MTDPSTGTAPLIWHFASAELDERNHELRVEGEAIALEEKPFNVLLCLLRAEGELVTKEEIFDTVWAGRVVTDGVLTQAIKRIRVVLGDADKSMLRTVHGHGFRLDVPITVAGRDEDSGTRLELEAGMPIPGLDGWVLDERLQTRPSNELWRIRKSGDVAAPPNAASAHENARSDDGEFGVLKLALDARAERALKREVTLNRVLIKELGDNPPLVRLTDWQFDKAPHWIRMPWFEHGSLADWVTREGGAAKIPLERRVRIVAEAAEAFARAHELGVMHKDIKPGNLLVEVTDGEPRLLLCDFGSGTATSRDRLARAGVTVMGFTQTMASEHPSGSGSSSTTTGTPAYMAPEILKGGVFSERSDVFSLGVMLYQLISGEMQSPLSHGWEEDIDDAGLREIIGRACAGKPQRRLAGMHELAEALRTWKQSGYAPPFPAGKGSTSPISDGMRLSAIMFTDMVGYSSLMRRDESIARELLDQHIADVRALLPRHQGRELDIIGDAFFIEFPSAVTATRFALEFQQMQAAYNDEAEDKRKFSIRIGIHIGDVESRDGKLFGHGVNYAARIEPLAPPGGIAVSPQVHQAVEARLNLPFSSIGRKKLKNVADSVEIFVLDETAVRDPAAAKSRKPRPAALPAAVISAILLLVTVAGIWWAFGETGSADKPIIHPAAAAPNSAALPRVALLPFDLLGLDERTEQVMTGLQSALIADLKRIDAFDLVEGPDLKAAGLATASNRDLGEILDSPRLIKGSIQQSGGELRVNLRIVNSADGISQWAGVVSGTNKQLFDFQERIGRTLAVQLGGNRADRMESRPRSNEIYEDYLQARSQWAAQPILGVKADEYQSLLVTVDSIVERDPGFVDGRLFALNMAVQGFSYSLLGRDAALSRAREHQAALQVLEAPAYKLAIARSAIILYFENNAAGALELLKPYREQLIEDEFGLPAWRVALGSTGRIQESLSLGEELLRKRPGDVNAISAVANWLGTLGETYRTLKMLKESSERLPEKSESLLALYGFYGWIGTSDRRLLKFWHRHAGNDSGQAARELAYAEGDSAELRRIARALPDEPTLGFGHQYSPAALTRASLLYAARADETEVRAQAQRAAEELQQARAGSDSASRMVAHALALAFMGHRERALTLSDRALAQVPIDRHWIDYFNASLQIIVVEALVAPPRAIARIDDILAVQTVRATFCTLIRYGVDYAPVAGIPEITAKLDDVCTQEYARQRQAIRYQLDELDQAATAAARNDRVALLPFDLLGLDEQSAIVMSGLQDALAGDLINSKTPWQLVLGSNLAAMGLKHAAPARIATALRAEQVIRGSVQQIGEALQINVQLIRASDETTLWAHKLAGQRSDLFQLQNELGSALYTALGGGTKDRSSSPDVIDAQGYEAYLAALSLYREIPWATQNRAKIEQMFAHLAIAADRASDYAPVHFLAVLAEANGYHWSWRDRAPARAAIDKHLLAMKALKAADFEMAVAEGASIMYLDDRSADALKIMQPYRAQILASAESAQVYMEALRGIGRLDETIRLGKALVSDQPSDFIAILRLLSDHYDQGNAAKVLEIAQRAASRFPNVGLVRDYGIGVAYRMTAEPRLHDPGPDWPADAAGHGEAQLAWQQLEAAYQRGDTARIAELLQAPLPQDYRWFGAVFRPGALTRAYHLELLGGHEEQVRALATRALDALQRVRAGTDTPARMIAAAQALALLSRNDEALRLLDEADAAIGPQHHRITRWNENETVVPLLALLNKPQRLLARINELFDDSPHAICGDLLHGFQFSVIKRIPEARAYVEDSCTPVVQAQREAIRRFFPDDPVRNVSKTSHRVAVLPFELLGLDEQSAIVMSGLQDALAGDLSGARQWRLVMGRNLDRMGVDVDDPAAAGKALNAARLIRGSIQQVGQQLRVNVQIIDAASGENQWADSVSGTREDLFGLQERIGRILVMALGGTPADAGSGQGPTNLAAYEAYLAALSHLQRFVLLSGPEAVGQSLRQANLAIAQDPDFAPARELAVAALATHFWFSSIDYGPARQQIDAHLAAMERLNAEPVLLATSRAVTRYLLDFDPRGAAELLVPVRPQALLRSHTARLLALVLRRIGREDEAATVFADNIRREPSELISLDTLLDLRSDLGQGRDLRALIRRFWPHYGREPGIAYRALTEAYAWTGDQRLLELLAARAPRLRNSPTLRLALGWQHADRAALDDLLDALPSQSPGPGHRMVPVELTRALHLRLAGAPMAEVHALAKVGRQRLGGWRQASDSYYRQLDAAVVLALLGHRSEALALVREASQDWPRSRDSIADSDAFEPKALVFALLGEHEALRALIDGMRDHPFLPVHCSRLALLPGALPRLAPPAGEQFAALCRPIVDTNQRALHDLIEELQ